ncbi:MAG: phage tail tape measure protein [Thermodesulfobacteriota bacterium]
MSKAFAVSVLITGTVGATLTAAIGSAEKQFNTLGSTIKALDASTRRIAGFRKAQEDVAKAGVAFEAARSKVRSLQSALATTPAPTRKMRDELARAGQELGKARERLDDKRRALGQVRAAMQAAGQATTHLKGQEERLGKAVALLKTRYEALGQAMSRRQANLDRRSALRTQLVDAVALGAALRAPVKAAMDLEASMVRLGTVVSATDLGGALAASRKQALAFARTNLSGAAEVLDIQYALNSAGLDAEAARIGSELVAKVATVTNGAAEGVGEVMATVFNNLGSRLEGDSRQRFARIGELLTKTQFKFQIRDFGQLGESMKYATPALTQFNVGLEQGVTLIGALNSAGLQGSMAGTALAASFRKLSGASEQLGFELARDAKGGLDFVRTLENLSDAIGGFADLDQETIDALQKAFGEEGQRGIVLLGQNLATLREAQRDVAEGSKGLVEESYRRFLESSSGQMKILQNRTAELGVALGTILLPGVNAVGGALGWFATRAATAAERFPRLTRVVVGATAGLVAGKVAAIGLGYAWTFVKGAWLSAVVGARAVGAALALVRTGAATAAGATWALGVAQKAWAAGSVAVTLAAGAVGTAFRVMWRAALGPIGWVIAGIGLLAGAGVALWKNWDTVKAALGAAWEGIKQIFAAGVAWVSEKLGLLGKVLAVSPLGLLFRAGKVLGSFAGRLFGGESTTAGTPGRTVRAAALGTALAAAPVAAASLPGPAPSWPELPPAAARGGGEVTVNAPFQGEIVIQGAGKDAKEIAEEIARVLRSREAQAAARARGALYDGG